MNNQTNPTQIITYLISIWRLENLKKVGISMNIVGSFFPVKELNGQLRVKSCGVGREIVGLFYGENKVLGMIYFSWV